MRNRIRITAGLGQYEDFEVLARAGVDEIFCGFVPLDWQLRYGNSLPLNRREVRFVHVQAGSLQELAILAARASAYGIKVSVTFNSLYYREEQLPVIAGYIREIIRIGIHDFIVADLGLALYLREQKVVCRLHISGELGEWNLSTIRMLVTEFETPAGKRGMTGSSLNDTACDGTTLARVIFHRKNSLSAMHRMTELLKPYGIESEAFLLNEMCHYTGGFCNSLHCDELVHMCQVPYELRIVGSVGRQRKAGVGKSCRSAQAMWELSMSDADEYDFDISDEPGYSGCGLCALWDFRDMGIDYVKIVGRGERAELMAVGIERVHQVLEILEEYEQGDTAKKKEFIGRIRKLQEKVCGLNCYYAEMRQ